MSNRFPKLIAFDLDYTLWDLWIDTHVTPPIRRDAHDRVLDKHGSEITFYPHVAQTLHRLRSAGVLIAACSRTAAPALAREALRLLLVPPKVGEQGTAAPERAIEFFDQLEIYPGSKLAHFRKIHQKTALPYSEMLFFDDEHRNREVESLGVTFHLVPSGLDERAFEQGLKEWRRQHPVEIVEDAGGEGTA